MEETPLINALHSERDSILENWENEARTQIAAAKSAESLVLRNHLVDFLDDLEKIIKLSTKKDVSQEMASIIGHDFKSSQAHGRVRASTPNYTIDQVIQEYALLRQVIINSLKSSKVYDPLIGEILTKQTELGILNAATEFYNSLMALQQKVFAAISHDLRRPLQANYIFLDLLDEEDDPEERRKLTERMRNNKDRMDQMMTNLLDSIGVQAGQGMRFVFEKNDLCEGLSATKEESEIIYGERMDFNMPDCPVTGHFDSSAITRLIENLISNAFKYGDRHKKVTVKIEDHKEEGEIVITVHNWGKAIPQEQQEMIFKYLERGSAQYSKVEGWGLGLSIVKHVTEAHKGRVEVDSSAENGTTFVARLSKKNHSQAQDNAKILN